MAWTTYLPFTWKSPSHVDTNFVFLVRLTALPPRLVADTNEAKSKTSSKNMTTALASAERDLGEEESKVMGVEATPRGPSIICMAEHIAI
jgi:hypothetical protein